MVIPRLKELGCEILKDDPRDSIFSRTLMSLPSISTYITYHQSVGKEVFWDLRRSTYQTQIADILLPKPHPSANRCQTGEPRCIWPVVQVPPHSLRNASEFQF